MRSRWTEAKRGLSDWVRETVLVYREAFKGQEMCIVVASLRLKLEKKTEPSNWGHWDSGLVQDLIQLRSITEAKPWTERGKEGQIFFFLFPLSMEMYGALSMAEHSEHAWRNNQNKVRIKLTSTRQKSCVQWSPSQVKTASYPVSIIFMCMLVRLHCRSLPCRLLNLLINFKNFNTTDQKVKKTETAASKYIIYSCTGDWHR